MNKKIITKHRLEVNAADLKSRLVENFLDIINDFAVESIEDLDIQVTAFKNCIREIRDNNWRKIFNDGFTMMLLDKEAMDFVEDFFEKKHKYKFEKEYTELEILVKDEQGNSWIIEECNVNY